ncbi:hypothetical protein PAXRUDRAFT_171275, partial [Paxillus rubicundulus Ve08.2h10]
AATPVPTTLHDTIDNDGFFNDIHIQSIGNKPKNDARTGPMVSWHSLVPLHYQGT